MEEAKGEAAASVQRSGSARRQAERAMAEAGSSRERERTEAEDTGDDDASLKTRPGPRRQ